jgi:hypothetical protein
MAQVSRGASAAKAGRNPVQAEETADERQPANFTPFVKQDASTSFFSVNLRAKIKPRRGFES